MTMKLAHRLTTTAKISCLLAIAIAIATSSAYSRATDSAACNPQGYNTQPLSEANLEILNSLSANSSQLKTNDECLKYVKCHMDHRAPECTPPSTKYNCYKDIENNYNAMMNRAATISGVPYTVQSCFFLRESFFNHKADNPTSSATGLGQFLTDLSSKITTIINDSAGYMPNKYAVDNLVDWKKKFAISEADKKLFDKAISYAGNASTKVEKRINDTDLLEYKKTLESLKTIMTKSKSCTATIKSGIANYITETNTQYQNSVGKKMWNDYFKGKTVPTKFDPKNGEQSIIASCIALKTIMEPTIMPDSGWGDDELKRYTFLSGAYFYGQNGFSGICSSSKNTISSCLSKLPSLDAKVTTTDLKLKQGLAQYMTSMNRCIAKNNWTPIVGAGSFKCGD